MKSEYNRRLRDWEPFDKIELKVVPRYKQSEMSGDEWRTGINLTFWFKGQMVQEAFFNTMKGAIMMLPAIWLQAQGPIVAKVLELEDKYCAQPGCPNGASSSLLKRFLKRLATNEGWLDKDMTVCRYYRKFCDQHERRGDCGLEDNDQNYSAASSEER